MIDYPQNPKEGTKAFDAFCKFPLERQQIFGDLISIHLIHNEILRDVNNDIIDADILACAIFSVPKKSPWLYILRLRFEVGAYKSSVPCCNAIAFCGSEITAIECILQHFINHSNTLTPQATSKSIDQAIKLLKDTANVLKSATQK